MPASSQTRAALVRLVGTVLAEQHDEWTEQRRCLGLDILAKSRLTKITNESQIDKEVTITAITAKSEDHAEASFKHHSSGRDRDEAAQA